MTIGQSVNQPGVKLQQCCLLLLLSSSVAWLSCTEMSDDIRMSPSGNSQITITPDLIREICLGMSLTDVETQLGSPGELIDTVDKSNNVATYEWRNADASYFWAVFSDARVTGMGHVGLLDSNELAEPTIVTQPPPEAIDCPLRY